MVDTPSSHSALPNYRHQQTRFARWNDLIDHLSVVSELTYARWMQEVGFEEVRNKNFVQYASPWKEGIDEWMKKVRKR